ncbi:MAG: hypothetical protein QOJ29_4152 [Thermoleophilaceae bacterium]|nr:hypothetical protein [Thermoleophilaceae bacterium]
MVTTPPFRHRIGILRANTLGDGRPLEGWWRLLATVAERRVPVSIGVSGPHLTRTIKHSDLDGIAAEIRSRGHELWQTSSDEPGTDPVARLASAQESTVAALGVRPTLVGAAHGSPGAGTVQAAERLGDFTDVWSAVETALRPLGSEPVPLLTPDPPRAGANPAVFDVEPGSWSDEDHTHFERRLDDLIEANWQLLTVADWHDYSQATAGGSLPSRERRAFLVALDEAVTARLDAAAAEPSSRGADFTRFYFNRYKRGTAQLRTLYNRLGWDTPGAHRCLDLGFGAGNWSFAYAALSDRHTVVGLDSDDYLVTLLSGIAAGLQLGGQVSFVHGSAHDLPFGDAEFDHVCCYNALNYFDADRALAEIARVLRPGGVLFLGVQNHRFYLKGFYEGLIAGEVGGALRRIDQLAYAAATAAGLIGSPTYSRIHDGPALEALAAAHGLATTVADAPLQERTQDFLGAAIFTTYVMTRVADDPAPHPRVDAPDDPAATAAFELHKTGDHAVAAAALRDLVESGRDDLRLHAVMASYAAGDHATALDLTAGFGPQADWSQGHWFAWLTCVTAVKPLGEARAAAATYLEARLTAAGNHGEDVAIQIPALPHRRLDKAEAELLGITQTLSALQATG